MNVSTKYKAIANLSTRIWKMPHEALSTETTLEHYYNKGLIDRLPRDGSFVYRRKK